MNLKASWYKEFSVGDINEFDFLLLYGGMYQPLKDLQHSVDQYLPNDQCICYKTCIGKKPIQKCQFNEF